MAFPNHETGPYSATVVSVTRNSCPWYWFIEDCQVRQIDYARLQNGTIVNASDDCIGLNLPPVNSSILVAYYKGTMAGGWVQSSVECM